MSDPAFVPPVNKLPPAVLLMFFAIAGVEAALALGNAGFVGGPQAIGWRLALVREWGFSAVMFDQMLASGTWPLRHVARLVTYPFIHLSFSHSLFAMVLLLALGKMVAERMGSLAFLAVFFVSSIGGALVYTLLLSDEVWLVGAYPGVYGLIGGYSFVLWRSLAAKGGPQAQAFTLITLLMGLQLIWSVFAEIGNTWVAELAGFAWGFALSFVLAPGEWAKLRTRFQQRR